MPEMGGVRVLHKLVNWLITQIKYIFCAEFVDFVSVDVTRFVIQKV